MWFHTSLAVCIALLVAGIMCAPIGASAPAPTVQIVFESDRDGDADLWLVQSDGTRERPLTTTDTPEGAPSWSPDGTTVVYACAPARNWELCTIDVASGRVTQLTHTAADEFDPRYTADGSEIVLETYPEHRLADIAIMPATGGVPKRLTTTPRVDDQDPAPDPSSTRIAFESGGDIVVMDTRDRGKVTPVTSGTRGESDPSFSTKGEIAFTALERGTPDILVAGPEGMLEHFDPANAHERRVTRRRAGLDGGRDGAAIFARASSASRGFRIFRASADGGAARAVTKGGDYDDAAPAPQPVAVASRLAHASRVEVRAANAPFCQSTWEGTRSADTKHGTGRSKLHVRKGRGRSRVRGRRPRRGGGRRRQGPPLRRVGQRPALRGRRPEGRQDRRRERSPIGRASTRGRAASPPRRDRHLLMESDTRGKRAASSGRLVSSQ